MQLINIKKKLITLLLNQDNVTVSFTFVVVVVDKNRKKLERSKNSNNVMKKLG